MLNQLLSPNHITWNSKTQTFEYHSLTDDSLEKLCASIPKQYRQLNNLARTIQANLPYLENCHDAIKIADYLESILQKIDHLNVQNELNQQLYKKRLHRTFIYAAADVIRQKSELIIPSNIRHLHSDTIKVFINEVYLKHQLLNYCFKTLRNNQIKQMPYPLVSEFLPNEQKGRQLEVVQTSSHIFALAPTLEYHGNPFSIRRFLLEERLFNGTLLLNGAVLNTASIQKNDEQSVVIGKMFRKQIQSIITLSGNIRQQVMDFVEQLNLYYEDELLPLLFLPFEVSDNVEQDINARLEKYEKMLMINILQPVTRMIRNILNHQDEFDYLYISMRQLFGDMIAAFQDFQRQPVLLMHKQSNTLFFRLFAYVAFLEKRRQDVFTVLENQQWIENHKKTLSLHVYAKKLVQEHIDEYYESVHAVHQQEKLVARSEKIWEKLFKLKEKQEERLEELKRAMREVQYAVHRKLFHLPDEIKQQVVHMEFEMSVILNEKMRSYAFPDGDNGMTALPKVLEIPEYGADFNLVDFAKQIGMYQHDIDEEHVLSKLEQVLFKRQNTD